MHSLTVSDLNVFCKNKGWLFEDIKNGFVKAGLRASTEPLADTRGLICVRSSEIRNVARLDKVVVQIHDLLDHDMSLFRHVAGVSFTHPIQHWTWKRAGFNGRYMIRPIGTRSEVVVPELIPERPTIGFFCGEDYDFKKGSNIFERAVQLARQHVDFDCLLIGRGLNAFSHLGIYEERAAGVDDYARIDALFCASVSPAVPLSVYEAQSAGKIVITTPRWMPGGVWPGVKVCENIKQLTNGIVSVIRNRERNFQKSAALRRAPYTFEDWVDKNNEFTVKCIKAAVPV